MKKNSIKYDKFLSDVNDPVNVNDFKKKILKLKLTENEAMILLRVFDPSSTG